MAETHLEIYSVFVDLTLVLIVTLRVIEHDIDIAHEMIDGLVFLSLLLSLCKIRSCHHVGLLPKKLLGDILPTYLDLFNCNWFFDFHVVLRHGCLVW